MQFHHVGGDRKTLFEDKVAVSATGQYQDSTKQEWVETTRNYLVSKAFEMHAFLLWAESAQAMTITDNHIAWLAASGFCSDHEPQRLSRDLWGYLNLCLTGKPKLAFNNVPKGNGFEAWRRLVVPIAPRSDARMHEMHGVINNPPPSKRLSDVMSDLETWENRLVDYYRCGGDPISEKTKVIIGLKMLPSTAPASLKLALKGIHNFEKFKDEVRQNIRFLEDFGPGHATAHMVGDDAPGMGGCDISDSDDSGNVDDPISVLDLPTCVMQALTPSLRDQLILAVNARRPGNRRAPPGRQRQQGPGARKPTPPRSAQDVRCGNCGDKGHTAQQCNKPRIPLEERKCHICGKTGHMARNCTAAKANVAEPAPFRPFNGEPKVLMISSDDGYRTVSRRRDGVPPPPTLGDFIRPPRRPQGQARQANRFAVFGNDGSTYDQENENSQRMGRENPDQQSLCASYSAQRCASPQCGCTADASIIDSGPRVAFDNTNRPKKNDPPRTGQQSTEEWPRLHEVAGGRTTISSTSSAPVSPVKKVHLTSPSGGDLGNIAIGQWEPIPGSLWGDGRHGRV